MERVIEIFKKIKWQQVSVPVKASFAYALCSIFNKGIQVITIPIFTRLLTTDEYGIYSVAMSWQSIILILVSLNIQSNTINNIIVKNKKEDEKTVVSSIVSLITMIGLCYVFTIILLGDFVLEIIKLPKSIVVLLIVEAILMSAFEVWAATQKFKYAYKKIVILSSIIIVLNPLLGLIMINTNKVNFNNGLLRILSVICAGFFVYIPIYIYCIYRGKHYFDKSLWIYTLKFSIPLLPHYLSQTVLNQVDRIMISNICGENYAAIYSVAYSLAILLMFVNKAINDSLTPWIYKNIAKGNYMSIKKLANHFISLMGFLNLILVCFSPELILILGSREYCEAVYIVPPVAASSFLIFVYSLFCNIEFYFEEKYKMLIVSVIGAILNIIMNSFFISKFGYIAAGYTTLICYIVFVLLHYLVVKKICLKKIHADIFDSMFIFMYSIFIIAAMIGIRFLFDENLIRYSIVLILLVVLFYAYKTGRFRISDS